MSAATAYAEQIDAVNAQVSRISAGRPPLRDTWGGAAAARFRDNPRRPLDSVLEHLAGYLRPDDVFLDIGGGAGRMSLPLASRCREVVDVEPSAGMGAAFVASAADAGITNARWLQAAWPDADVMGDLALICHVTYFVRDVVPFVEKLRTNVRRRVMILVSELPPAAGYEPYFPYLFGEPMALRPTYQALLPVLWEVGVLPDVRILPTATARQPDAETREQAIDRVLSGLEPFLGVELRTDAALRRTVEEQFNSFFDRNDRGFTPRYAPIVSSVLITWEPGARP